MTSWLLIAAGVVWLLSLGWVIQDAYARFPTSTLIWWAFLALILGPIAVPFYLSERQTRHAQMNKAAFSGGRDIPVPEGHRLVIDRQMVEGLHQEERIHPRPFNYER